MTVHARIDLATRGEACPHPSEDLLVQCDGLQHVLVCSWCDADVAIEPCPHAGSWSTECAENGSN